MFEISKLYFSSANSTYINNISVGTGKSPFVPNDDFQLSMKCQIINKSVGIVAKSIKSVGTGLQTIADTY